MRRIWFVSFLLMVTFFLAGQEQQETKEQETDSGEKSIQYYDNGNIKSEG